VSWVGAEPSAFILHSCELALLFGGNAVRLKMMIFPSGLKLAFWSMPVESSVSRIPFEPSALATQRPAWGVPVLSKTIFAPSGEKLGKRFWPPDITSVGFVPSAFTVKMSGEEGSIGFGAT
jgi:hypothetical protein